MNIVKNSLAFFSCEVTNKTKLDTEQNNNSRKSIIQTALVVGCVAAAALSAYTAGSSLCFLGTYAGATMLAPRFTACYAYPSCAIHLVSSIIFHNRIGLDCAILGIGLQYISYLVIDTLDQLAHSSNQNGWMFNISVDSPVDQYDALSKYIINFMDHFA